MLSNINILKYNSKISVKYKIPIVYYHSIANTPLSVKVNNFKDQMRYLKENGFTTILFKDLVGG